MTGSLWAHSADYGSLQWGHGSLQRI